MPDARTDLQELIKHYAIRNEGYHSHKERMAYLPTGVFVLATFTLASSQHGPYFPENINAWVPAVGYIISAMIVTILLVLFTLRQLDLKYLAQVRCNAADEALNIMLTQIYTDDWAEPSSRQDTNGISDYKGALCAPRLYRQCIDRALAVGDRPVWQDRTVIAMYLTGCAIFIARIILIAITS